MAGEFDGVYQNVPSGFVHVFEKLGWQALPHVYDGTHHGFYGTMMKWGGDGPEVFPTDWRKVA
jgi:hypothetical protein